nr:sigma-70 family RNA polymerase sigma factor [Brevibacillus massiliensis]
MQDEQLIRQIIAGDAEAFRIFLERYRQYLFQVVYSVLRHQKDAEDVTQEVFVQIYLSLPQYQSQGIKAWMTRIAVNKAIDWKRKAQRSREELTESLDQLSVPVAAEAADSPVLQKEYRETIRGRLHELPQNYREVVYAYYFEEKSYQEIASEQGIEPKSVESKLYRARKWIRSHWQEGDFR